MKPYYEHAGIQIFHGDCREILPTLDVQPDLVLTDPPYGIKFQVGHSRLENVKCGKLNGGYIALPRGGRPLVFGDGEKFDPAHLLTYPRLILFGANYYHDALPARGGWLVWDKTGGGRGPQGTSFADVELAWTSFKTQPWVIRHLWKGLVRDSETGTKLDHPTQKPVALMAQLVADCSEPGQLILDPYLGAGSVLVAAKQLQRRAIGIEIEERYCEISSRRLAQDILPL